MILLRQPSVHTKKTKNTQRLLLIKKLFGSIRCIEDLSVHTLTVYRRRNLLKKEFCLALNINMVENKISFKTQQYI